MRENDIQVTSTKSIPGGMEQEKFKQLRNIPEVLDPEFDNIIVAFF